MKIKYITCSFIDLFFMNFIIKFIQKVFKLFNSEWKVIFKCLLTFNYKLFWKIFKFIFEFLFQKTFWILIKLNNFFNAFVILFIVFIIWINLNIFIQVFTLIFKLIYCIYLLKFILFRVHVTFEFLFCKCFSIFEVLLNHFNTKLFS